MNKEQIIDEAYKNYSNEYEKGDAAGIRLDDGTERVANIDEFIRRIRVDSEFAEKWGLKIEVKYLTYDERNLKYKEKFGETVEDTDAKWELNSTSSFVDDLNNGGIPTKLITITYNDKTIESYE